MLSCTNLRVRYRNGALGIDGVSLGVSSGEVVALLGPNGAGKTSTLRGIGGFLKAEGARVTDGRVVLDGADVTNNEPHRMSRLGVASVPESRKLLPALTVTENLQAIDPLPPRATRAEAYQRVYDLFPVLYERRRERAGRLSGGEQQMLAISRAIVADPRVLLIDELTLGLHVSLQPRLFDVVRSVADGGTAVLLVDENTSFALEVADRCYVLRSGALADEGPSSKFRDNELLAAGYVGEP